MNYKEFLMKRSTFILLIVIFLIAYQIRSVNIVPGRLLSFDPIFQYRYTEYLAAWGHIPLWDELSYYTGRMIDFALTAPLLYYITVLIYKLQPLGFSLITTASYASAIYGAMIVFPAFLLARELSNKYGGLFAAILIGTAPQILVRTFGSSYTTDSFVVFFILLTLYLGVHAFKQKTIRSFALLTAGFVAFMMAWIYFIYPFFIMLFFIFVYIVLGSVWGDKSWASEAKLKFSEKFKKTISNTKSFFIISILLFAILAVVGYLNYTNMVTEITGLLGFAGAAEKAIVNISIAELQTFNVFSISGLVLLLGNIISGNAILDAFITVFFVFLIGYAVWKAKKTDLITLAFLVALIVVGVATSIRGIRFTAYTSSLLLTVVGAGFGYLAIRAKEDKMIQAMIIGTIIFAAFVAINVGENVGAQLGPDINANWENAWSFLRTQTPEMSLVGTWWDPGHMITGLADRRVIADGAHCTYGGNGQDACFYTINDRIVDLGKIMATNNETVSLQLIRKYQGDSPNVYWIASDDLIGKFQWVQYFGLGCDARTDTACPLYYQSNFQNSYNVGGLPVYNYGGFVIIEGQQPIAYATDGNNAILIPEVIYYDTTGQVKSTTISNRSAAIESLRPLQNVLNVTFVDRDFPYSIWISESKSYVVLIPPNLRNNVFTKMFMLEGLGLQHFRQVFRNEQVKIYEVV